MHIRTFAAIIFTVGLGFALLIGWGIGAAANAIWPDHSKPAIVQTCTGDHDGDCPRGEPDNDR